MKLAPTSFKEIYLKAYADGREARGGISAWMTFYNMRRPHQALGNRTPMAVWRAGVTGVLLGNAVDMTLRLDTLTRRQHAHRGSSNNTPISWREG